MKHIRKDLNSNRIIYKKYAKNYSHNMNILTFLKSNYKYKRRSIRCHISNKKQRQWYLPYHQQKHQNKNLKHKLPAQEEAMTNDKQITNRIPFYENIKLDKILRILFLIMQQAKPTNNNNSSSYYSKSKSDNSWLVAQLVAKMKTSKNANKSLANVNEDGDGISVNHRAYKDANKDTDVNVDISNIADEISHQQHNYDKVSTITSTPIKCQRRKHHQLKATKSASSSQSHSHSPSSFSLTTTRTATMTLTTLLSTSSSSSIANYETCQCSVILRHYVRDKPSIHQHQYHHKSKHTLHHHQPLHIKSLTTSRVLNINNSNINNSGVTTPSATATGTSIYHSVDQYVNSTWNRSYTLSCLLLTLFIAFTIGVRGTTAGACWQTVLDNGKCNEIFSLNISKSECCGANQEFAYTEREPTNVEYFFATAIGGGMECSPCLESCRNVKCGPNKKCVKRKGRPKCICAPECGAARRKRKQRDHLMLQEQAQQQQQHHTLHLVSSHVNDDNDDDADDGGYFQDVSATIQSSYDFKIKIEKSQQSRDTRSLSSEITNVNLGLGNGKDAMISSSGVTSSMERHHCKEHNQNQRKLIHIHHSHGQQHQQQQPNHKNQEPKGSRRLLITANVEHTEKPTTRRLQIFSNVRTTHARRHNSSSNNNNRNKHDQHEDTDPSDYNEEEEEGNNEDYNYNDAEDEAKEAKKKNNNSNINFDNGNNNGHGNNKNNRNDESTRFLNQSPSRHQLKTNTKPNNNNRNRNSNNKNKNNNSSSNKNKNKNHHDLQTTKIQQHSSNNNTRVRHSQQNGRHAENTPHHRHNNHHNHHQHHHRQQQQQQHHHNHQQQNQNHGRHKHNNSNKQHHKQQSIVLKKPKNNKDYNITASSTTNNIGFDITTNKVNSASNTDTDTTVTDVYASSTMHQSGIVKSSTTATSLNISSLSAALATTTTAAFNSNPEYTQSQLLLSSFPSTTPVNSTMSADDGAAADDHNHSRLPNHGSKIAASFLLSSSSSLPSPSSSSHLQTSAVSARSSSESAVVTMSAKGEGVLHHDHKHRIEIPMKTASNNNNNNNDNKILTLHSNLHNNQQLQQQQQDQQQQTHPQLQAQQHQQRQHYQTPLFDGISEQFDLIGFPNKQQQQQQQTVTNGDNVKPLNPVCGTDGRTYNTECQLRKRACRTDNPNLQIAYRGHCRTTCNGVKCLNGLICVEDQYSMPHCIACKIECPQDDYENDAVDATKAVCGADGKTYKSACDINRMICKIGRSIGVAYPGPCREDQVTCDDINCGPKQVCLIDLLTHKPRCTSCRYKCSRKRRPSSPHYEEGKICGVNNHTYNSWCEMRKDSCSTGFYIDVKYSGDCH
ncbi:putative uncharacterized protein DDB_G0277255 isoform X1 [Lucilia sericata]|uniref:putative uncharacterized protein DDB_G0277255 isoform X1 n=1 Tax=Lucilia sericata TaxID=13632 RepID=UPI0018A83179|nr:putative uncharacterized protein DDB_G0277255 isoform X1 [Lucilia sericata]XP_037828393.1 putative uncharacterized protein DDB_G0277255 isoform X1 [Lucilia sericata]